ncbi:YqgQ family protein [Brevibacillus sp. SYP-B805]|uniref:YqgQ family protein n=1 Tax=Brevibacillus sp. SYP-B805 TaxID=1578199 RepID=UPI0013EE2723|nr:YqgQ family protein [Brevibacillus sp. SYP-B805]
MNSGGFDLRALLKRFGIVIYTGDRLGDLLLMEDEIRELRQMGLIDGDEFVQAMAALAAEKSKIQ